MQYTIENNTLTIITTPDLRGVRSCDLTIYSGGSNKYPEGYISTKPLEINTGKPGRDISLSIPEGTDLNALEKGLDGILVRLGDMNKEDFEQKWPAKPGDI